MIMNEVKEAKGAAVVAVDVGATTEAVDTRCWTVTTVVYAVKWHATAGAPAAVHSNNVGI